ncbi:MAG: hypothetical protein U1F36_00300 [Planctomycetota bacterium]
MIRNLCCGATLLLLLPSATAQDPGDRPDARQIHWQRSLDDALALARAEERPLLLAVNMDGESASDRIVNERYRDPAFVAATRDCVCLVASLFRHNARDHDDQGRRIPCPRLGVVTCGEHIALEQQLWDRFLSDGERVAPRHALILPDGTKAWDISLAFDMHDIDKALFESVRALREARADEPVPPQGSGDGTWDALASRRDAMGRAALEDAIAHAPDERTLSTALDALGRRGDGGSLDALRVFVGRWPALSDALRTRWVETVRALNLETAAAGALRERIQALDPGPTDPDGRAAAACLPWLASLDGASVATRSLLLACRAIGDLGEPARAALAIAFGVSGAAAIESACTDLGGTPSLRDLLDRAALVTRAAAPGALPRHGAISDAMPDADALIATLGEVDAQMKGKRDDATLNWRYAKASLDLARRHMESKQRDVQILLEDAELHFAHALAKEPSHAEWWIERARTAYFMQDYGRQVDCGRRALQLALGESGKDLQSSAVLDDDRVIESLRWVGDGNARQLADRAGKDPVAELRGIVEGVQALGLVAASPFGDATDWTSFASFCGALGLWREELAIAEAGALRLPASAEVRARLNDALWNGGAVARAPEFAERIARLSGPTADALWFSGYALVLSGEQLRREELPRRAVDTYRTALDRFRTAILMRKELASTTAYWIAMAWLGQGMAQVRAGERAAAADCLVAAIKAQAELGEARDGLGYDVLDLVDKIFEWRESGASQVDPIALLDRIDALAPDSAFYAVAISDSLLREALRADGRNPQRAMRDTVDAGGKPIRMLLGLPTEEGDVILRASIAAGRRAAARAKDDTDRHPLAQSDTIWAERMLERGRSDGVAEALAEATALLHMEPPAKDADVDAQKAVAAHLRSQLGEARPRLRPGR